MRFCLLLGFFVCLLQSSVFGQSPVWKVTRGEQVLYLGGTCHILRASDLPLPAAFDVAYEAADTLVFEVDPAEMEDPAMVSLLMSQASYTDGRSLKKVLSAEAYALLAKHGQRANLPIEMINSFKPGMAVMMITIQELTKIGVTQEGVDMIYAKRGAADGKAIHSLETAAFQIDLLVSAGEGFESEFVLYSLRDLEQIESDFDEMIRAWRVGDNEALERLFVDDMREFPEVYEAFLADRNANWMTDLKAMLATPEVEFVLVGAGHMVGPDGLIAHLEKMGCTVEALDASR